MGDCLQAFLLEPRALSPFAGRRAARPFCRFPCRGDSATFQQQFKAGLAAKIPPAHAYA
jgi:hypothetical protein